MYDDKINPNSPECYNKDEERAPYIKMGFASKEDYEVYERRMSDRKKTNSSMDYK